MLAGLFGVRTQVMSPKAKVLRGTYLPEALWDILHHPDEKTVCIYNDELNVRTFGARRIRDELKLMLGNSGSSLKVYVPARRLQQFVDHPHDPFIEFIREYKNASITAVDYGCHMPNAIWGGQQAFLPITDDYGVIYRAGDAKHRELGIQFANLPRLFACEAQPVLVAPAPAR